MLSLLPLLTAGWEEWAWGGGLSLIFLWSISVAPARSGTAFSLPLIARAVHVCGKHGVKPGVEKIRRPRP